MTLAFLFWLLFILWIVFGVWQNWPRGDARTFYPLGDRFIVIVLIFLLGWCCFGFPVRDSGPPHGGVVVRDRY